LEIGVKAEGVLEPDDGEAPAEVAGATGDEVAGAELIGAEPAATEEITRELGGVDCAGLELGAGAGWEPGAANEVVLVCGEVAVVVGGVEVTGVDGGLGAVVGAELVTEAELADVGLVGAGLAGVADNRELGGVVAVVGRESGAVHIGCEEVLAAGWRDEDTGRDGGVGVGGAGITRAGPAGMKNGAAGEAGGVPKFGVLGETGAAAAGGLGAASEAVLAFGEVVDAGWEGVVCNGRGGTNTGAACGTGAGGELSAPVAGRDKFGGLINNSRVSGLDAAGSDCK